MFSHFWSTLMFQYLQLSGQAPSGQTAASEKRQKEAALRPENHPDGPPRRLSFTRQTFSLKCPENSPQQEVTALFIFFQTHSGCCLASDISLTALPQYLGEKKKYLYFMRWRKKRRFWRTSPTAFSLFLFPAGLKRADTKRSGLRVSFNISSLWSNTTNTFK